MLEGLWRQHELFDGTYSFADLLDIHEFLDVKQENEWRYQQWMESQAKHK